MSWRSRRTSYIPWVISIFWLADSALQNSSSQVGGSTGVTHAGDIIDVMLVAQVCKVQEIRYSVQFHWDFKRRFGRPARVVLKCWNPCREQCQRSSGNEVAMWGQRHRDLSNVKHLQKKTLGTMPGSLRKLQTSGTIARAGNNRALETEANRLDLRQWFRPSRNPERDLSKMRSPYWIPPLTQHQMQMSGSDALQFHKGNA